MSQRVQGGRDTTEQIIHCSLALSLAVEGTYKMMVRMDMMIAG